MARPRSNENEKYLAAYLKNEYNANRLMTVICAAAAVLLGTIWVFYLTGVFPVPRHSLLMTNIAIPICMGLLLSPLLFLRTEWLKRPGYKYYLIIAFIVAISYLNVAIPKHMVLAWAIPIILVNHYYNPRLGKTTFAVVAGMMLITMYLAMLFGEFDPYLLTGEIDSAEESLYSIHLDRYFPDTYDGRIAFLSALTTEAKSNRYLAIFTFYYFGRMVSLTIIFFLSNTLNKRTYKLFLDEFNANAEQAKINNDLNVAKEIQLSSLPTGYFNSSHCEITAELHAAKEVGGDLYFYTPLDENHVAIAIGDVSGKGIPAAMFMMKTITCLRNFLSLGRSPAETLREVNRALFDGNENQVFVTCFLGIIDFKAKRMVFANAGHNKPLFGQSGRFRYLPCKAGFLLGVMEEAVVCDEVMPLRDGDSILLYTDGVTEARSSSGEFFGEKRLQEFANSKDFSCPLEMTRGLLDTVEEFAAGAEQSDDITHLLIKISDNEKNRFDDRHVDANAEAVSTLLAFIKDFATQEKLDAELVSNLLVIGDELVSNIIKYAYDEDEKGDIYLRLLRNDTEFVMTLVDHGKPFNSLAVNRDKLSGDAQSQPVGGLGILIVKRIMDNITYDYLNKKNILILRKKLS